MPEISNHLDRCLTGHLSELYLDVVSVAIKQVAIDFKQHCWINYFM